MTERPLSTSPLLRAVAVLGLAAVSLVGVTAAAPAVTGSSATATTAQPVASQRTAVDAAASERFEHNVLLADARRHAADQARQAEEARLAEQARLAEEARVAEEARLAAEAAAKAEAERQAAQERATRGTERAAPAAPAGDARSIARTMLADFGWGDSQFSCLDRLWQKESNWSHTAQNRSSGAYGIPQSLPGSKMASAGGDWRTNPATQIRWGLGYISDSYGTPCAAWGHSQSSNWY